MIKWNKINFYLTRSIFLCFRGASDPIYKAIWADNKSFDEVLISKRMVQDHMPDNVLGALEKVRFTKWGQGVFQVWRQTLLVCHKISDVILWRKLITYGPCKEMWEWFSDLLTPTHPLWSFFLLLSIGEFQLNLSPPLFQISNPFLFVFSFL